MLYQGSQYSNQGGSCGTKEVDGVTQQTHHSLYHKQKVWRIHLCEQILQIICKVNCSVFRVLEHPPHVDKQRIINRKFSEPYRSVLKFNISVF